MCMLCCSLGTGNLVPWISGKFVLYLLGRVPISILVSISKLLVFV